MTRKGNIILAISLTILLLFVSSSYALAQVESSAKVKPFYVHFGLGYSNISYPGELEEFFGLFDNHIGGIGFDLGAYIPLPDSNNTIIGINGNGAVDAYFGTGLFGESISMTIDHTMFSLSAMHFLKEIGLGPFVRADAGLSRLGIKVSDIFTSVEADSDYGYGLLLGGGTAFPISDKGKAMLNVNYSFRHVEGENYKILGLTVGYLY